MIPLMQNVHFFILNPNDTEGERPDGKYSLSPENICNTCTFLRRAALKKRSFCNFFEKTHIIALSEYLGKSSFHILELPVSFM